MPLIIITGLPCSGKTHRAQQIAADLESYIASSSSDPGSAKKERKKTVQIIPSQHASADTASPPSPTKVDDGGGREPAVRDQIYNSATQEKTARAAEFSAIKRAVSRDNIVIADGLNYIKGYRYQLWCEAKAAGTRCCVVHVAAQEEDCRKWNRERQMAWGRRERDEKVEDEDDEKKSDSDTAGERGRAQGETVMGDLVPESHTAIYGDRIGEKVARSRSSSMDGFDTDQDDNNERSRPQDTMTLKSLYIGDRPDHDPKTEEKDTTTDANVPTRSRNSSCSTPPPSTNIVPPSPKTSQPYSSSTLKSLMMRYEPPSPFSRWDTPLFTIPSADAIPPGRDIWTALFPPPTKPTSKKASSQQKTTLDSAATTSTEQQDLDEKGKGEEEEEEEKVKRHAATVLPKATGPDALQILENTTMEVVKHLLTRARETGVADVDCCGTVDLYLTPSTTTDTNGSRGPEGEKKGCDNAAGAEADEKLNIYVPSTVALSQPLLQRLRRKYTQIQRGGIAHGQGYVKGRTAVIKGFVEFLEHEWNDQD